jgi:AAA ATPase domain
VDELTNPFRPGAGTSPPALVGRDDVIDAFGVSMRRAMAGRPGKSVMPVGLRGVGKTVLLNRFAEIAAAEGFQVGFIESPEDGDFTSLLAIRLRRILLDMEAGGVTHKVRRALRVLKTFTAQLPDGTRLSIDVDALRGVADSGNLADDVTDLLVAAGEAAADKGLGVLLVVDEVQYLAVDELAALITAIHRTTQLDLPVVFTGAGLPQLPALSGRAKSYAERLFEFPVIGPLGPDDARAAIAIPAGEEGVELTRPALDAIVERSFGYPYFLQEWGSHVWNVAESSPIDIEVVREAVPQVRQRLDRNFFSVRFDRLTPRERQYLRALAELGPGPHRSGQVAAVLGVKVESVAPRRAALIDKGMIYSPAHGQTEFTVPLFDDFLRRVMPQLPVGSPPRAARRATG